MVSARTCTGSISLRSRSAGPASGSVGRGDFRFNFF